MDRDSGDLDACQAGRRLRLYEIFTRIKEVFSRN
jgi:hypothetical protein